MEEANPQFTRGMEVEVCSDEEGLRGVWFVGKVVRLPSKNNKVLVEYETLMASEKGSKPLRESVNVVNLRPIPPREVNRSFNVSDEVDAYHNDGWWEGVVLQVVGDSKYLVYFRPGKEQLEFHQSDLRIHREWVNGSWVPPMLDEDQNDMDVEKQVVKPPQLKQKQTQMEKREKSTGRLVSDQTKQPSKLEVDFNKGMTVEVCSDEDGFVGAWFSAKIIEVVGNNKFVVEYDTLKTEDESELLKETVDLLQIRPPPPEIPQIDRFTRLEEVDAFYQEGWWVGVVSKVLSVSRYYVYFRGSNEELEFEHSQLRFHQDWIDGKWFRSSEAFML